MVKYKDTVEKLGFRMETKGVEKIDVVVFVEGDPQFVYLPAYSAIIFFLVKQKT